MPDYIDEAWEFYVADPEIAEALACDAPGFDAVLGGLAHCQKSDGVGYRFGSGNPDRFTGGGRPDDAPAIIDRRVLTPIRCPCGVLFQPKASRTVYCWRACQPRSGPPKTLPDATCPACGVRFRRKCRTVKFCKRKCADRGRNR